MARPIPPDRIARLVEAAIRVFAQKGFRRAQMADIAEEMSLSTGSLYNYVESKEALFFLVVDRGFGEPSKQSPSLPIPTPKPGAIVRRLRERIRETVRQPLLDVALSKKTADDPKAELAGILRELYRLLYRVADATNVIDRSALDLPDLAKLWYGEMRGGMVARLASLIELRAKAGQYRKLPHAAAAARLLLETIVWFARNRRNDPASEEITDQIAETTTIDFLVNGLIAREDRRTKKRNSIRGAR